MTTASKMDWLVTHGEYYLQPESRSTNWMLTYKKAKVHYEPLGVVAAIVSWNYRMRLPSIFIYRVYTQICHSPPQCLLTGPSCYLCRQRLCGEVL